MSGLRAHSFHNRQTLFPTATALSLRVCLRASQGEDTGPITPPPLLLLLCNTLTIMCAHEKNKTNVTTICNSCDFWQELGSQRSSLEHLWTSRLPSVFILALEWRWCRVCVKNSQWIYYPSLSGPVCQVLGPSWDTCKSVIWFVNCRNMLEWHNWKWCWNVTCTDNTNSNWGCEGSRRLLCLKTAGGGGGPKKIWRTKVGHPIDEWQTWRDLIYRIKDCDGPATKLKRFD